MLKKIRDKKLFFIGSSYVILAGILVLAWLEKWFDSFDYSDEKAARFKLVVPFVMLFFFLLLTIYFINYYLKAVHPFSRDLKKGLKELIYFEPESYKTPFFNAYYLKTPSKKNAMVRIDKEFFDLIKPGAKACIALSLYSRFLFSIEVEGKRIEFNEKNARIDV